MSPNLAEIILKAVEAKIDVVMRYENTNLDSSGKLQVKVFPRNAHDDVMSGSSLLPETNMEITVPSGAVLKTCSLRILPCGPGLVSFIGNVRDPESHTISGESTIQSLRDRVSDYTDPYQFLQHLLYFADGAQPPKPGQGLASL